MYIKVHVRVKHWHRAQATFKLNTKTLKSKVFFPYSHAEVCRLDKKQLFIILLLWKSGTYNFVVSEWPVPTYFDCTERKATFKYLSLSIRQINYCPSKVLDLAIAALDFHVLSLQDLGQKEEGRWSQYSGPKSQVENFYLVHSIQLVNIWNIIYHIFKVQRKILRHDWSSKLLKKIQAWTGFKPMTAEIPVQCSSN